MRTVDEKELKRLKKRGKVRRKMGEQPEKEKPAVVAPDDKEMSGSASAEPPPPAPTPEPPAADVGMASMQASMKLRDGLLTDLIENNTRAIQEFSERLAQEKPRIGVPYRHKVVRDKKTSLIDEVISTPMET